MKSMSRYAAIGVLGLSFIGVYLMVMNFQIFYGGFEGLLYHGLNELIEAENLEVRAEVALSPSGETVSELMEMTFVVEGILGQEGQSKGLSIGLLSGKNQPLIPVAKLIQEENRWVLMPEGEAAEAVDLSSFMVANDNKGPFDHRDWDRLYETLIISEIRETDQRLGRGYLEAAFINYQLDVVRLLTMDQRAMVEENFGEGILEEGFALLHFQMDNKGRLAAIRIDLDAILFTADGWVTLEER